jgi:hypothetical protein
MYTITHPAKSECGKCVAFGEKPCTDVFVQGALFRANRKVKKTQQQRHDSARH